MSNNKKIGVGIIGYGMAAQTFHAPFIALNPDLELRKIVSRGNTGVVTDYPSAQFVPDSESLLSDNSVSLVVITTPNSSHFSLSDLCLSAGKNVVVEKPFCVSSEEADKLIKKAKQQNKILSVFHNRRWDSDYKTVKKLLERKKLGRLVEYESHFDRFRNIQKPGAWRDSEAPGSGMLYDLGSHLIDQALVLFGIPKLLTADIRRQREFSNADDCFELFLHYEGLKVILKSSMLVRENPPRFILHGTEGAYVKYGTDPQEDLLKKGIKPDYPQWGEEDRKDWGRLYLDKQGSCEEIILQSEFGSYQDFYKNIVSVISGEAELAVNPEEALNVIRVIEAAVKSNSERRSVQV